jgi:hypothetical protein
VDVGASLSAAEFGGRTVARSVVRELNEVLALLGTGEKK